MTPGDEPFNEERTAPSRETSRPGLSANKVPTGAVETDKVLARPAEAEASARQTVAPHLLQSLGRQCDNTCLLSRLSPSPGRLWGREEGGGREGGSKSSGT